MQPGDSDGMPECTFMLRAGDLTSVLLRLVAFTSLPSAKMSTFVVREKLLAGLSHTTLAFRRCEWMDRILIHNLLGVFARVCHIPVVQGKSQT